jgi:FMN phosphatase YigB (HAD superfamily)
MNTKLFSLGLGLALLTATVQAVELQLPCTPANTTFAFDIDQVLLDHNQPISSTLWDYRWDVAKNIVNPYLVYCIVCLAYQKATGRAYLELLKIQAPRLAEMVEHIMLDKKPIAGMEQLVNNLRAQAYSLVIASNMGEQDFAYYKEKFRSLFGNFDFAQVVPHTANGIPLIKKKPSLEYFQQLKTELAEHNLAKENLIFIDDKKKNVEAFEINAKNGTPEVFKGFKGIQFKNTLQFQADLAKLGIIASATV